MDTSSSSSGGMGSSNGCILSIHTVSNIPVWGVCHNTCNSIIILQNSNSGVITYSSTIPLTKYHRSEIIQHYKYIVCVALQWLKKFYLNFLLMIIVSMRKFLFANSGVLASVNRIRKEQGCLVVHPLSDASVYYKCLRVWAGTALPQTLWNNHHIVILYLLMQL